MCVLMSDVDVVGVRMDVCSRGQVCFGGQDVCLGVQPDEGELLSVQPGAEDESWVLSERGDDGGEDQRYQHKAGWEDHLVQWWDQNNGNYTLPPSQLSMYLNLHFHLPSRFIYENVTESVSGNWHSSSCNTSF